MLSTINRPMAGAAVTLTAAMLAIPMMAKSRTPVALLPVRPTNRMVRMVANPAQANGQIPVVSRPSTEKGPERRVHFSIRIRWQEAVRTGRRLVEDPKEPGQQDAGPTRDCRHRRDTLALHRCPVRRWRTPRRYWVIA